MQIFIREYFPINGSTTVLKTLADRETSVVIFSGKTLSCGNVYAYALKFIRGREVFVDGLEQVGEALGVHS